MAKAVNIARSHRLDGIGEYYFSRRLREIAEIEAATGDVDCFCHSVIRYLDLLFAKIGIPIKN